MPAAIEVAGLEKTFTMHMQGGARLPVVSGVAFAVRPGECVVLAGPSGVGKSSILRMIYGSYRCDRGHILVRNGDVTIDVAAAEPRQIIALRRHLIGYVSQFLRALPRVTTIDVVAEPIVTVGVSREEARRRAAELLRRVNIPERLLGLPPATFSGGEQQRVNIARGFLPDLPVLLLDEPTASLDAVNRAAVVDLIAEKKRQGTAIIAVVHDDDVRAAIADTIIDISRFASAA
ncbi:MAG: phosphonate C-P lyase system protein PhnL [Rhizobiales bacterium]|nr:phosphonate C-P lyase system protein PhnL [Hyphomicrobiales bacterium]